MAIIQLSKIQHRTGANVDLPQLAEGEFGFATDERRLYIGNDANLYPPLGTSTTTQTEILTEVSTLNWSRLGGSANTTLNIEAPVEDGQLIVANSNTWTNAGGTSSLPINLGNIQNLNIGGGLNGYVLTTDGSGNLSWQGSGVVTYAIANVSQANPALVTTTEDNAILTGLQVTIFGVGGMTQLKTAGASGTNKFYVIKQSNSTFTLYSDSTLLSAVDSSAFSAATPNTGNAVTSFYENGTGNPGGGNRNIQFNDGSGLFGGIGTFTFDKTTANLSLTGNANIIYDVNANNFIGNFTGPIGNTTANTGNFTTITANSTISTSGNVSAGGNVVVAGNISTGSNLTTAATLSVAGNAIVSGNVSVSGTTKIIGHLVPSADITYNLGSPTNRWNDLYLNSNSLVLGNATLSTSASGDFEFSNSNITTKNANLGNLATANFFGGTLIASSSSQPNISTVGNLTGLNVTGLTNLGNVGNVRITGSTANYVLTATDTNGSMQWLPTQYIETPAKGSNQSVQFNNGNIITGSANFTFDKDFNELTVPNLEVGTAITGNANVSVTGNITGSRVNATSINTTTSVNVGTTLSVAGNVTSNGILTINNNAAITGNVSITGNLTANFTNVGNLSAFGNINAARLTVGATVVANGNITGGNILTLGNISANGNVNANNVNVANDVIIAGQANATRFVATAEIVAGQYIQAAGKAYIGEDVLANGNVRSNSNIFTTGNVSAGGNLTIAANAKVNGDANVVGNLAAGNITTLGLISARGDINGANITANGFITITGNITANGAISANGNITTLGTITANALNVGAMSTSGNIGVNNLAVANFVSSSLIPNTDISLALGGPSKRWSALYTGNIINIGDKTIISDANGIGFGAALFNQANANIANLRTAYANLPDTANIKIPGGTSGAILKTDGNGNISWGAPSSFVSGASGSNTQVQFNDANLMAGSANFVFNKTSNTLTVDRIIANGAALTSITAANITGTVSSASVAGTISANAQPNITSVGNLTGLTVGYYVSNTFGNNLSTGVVDLSAAANVFINPTSMKLGSGWSPGKALIAVSPTANLLNDNGRLAWAYPNTMEAGASNIIVDSAAGLIRFSVNTVGNVVTMSNTGLTTSNLTVGTIANLGTVSGLRIAGGSAGQILQSNGGGGVQWVNPASTSGLAFGSSNVIVDANNVNLSANGVANVLQVTTTGIISANANHSGTANIGTLNVGTVANLGAVANVRISGGTAGYLLQSNGAGGVVWTAPSSTSGLVNGSSNIAVDANSLIRFGVAGTANIFQVNATGITTGAISATGIVTANGIAVINNGNITMPGTASTSGKVTWPGTSACSAPQLTTYSGGTRLVFHDSIATSGSAGFAMGIESGNMWFNTDVVASGFKWYGGITQIATLNNASGFSAVGNITGSNVLTAGVMSSTGNATHGNIITGGIITANGNITGANVIATSVLSTLGNANVGNVNATSNVQAGNLRTTGTISATGNIQGAFFIGNGSQLTGVLREPTANIANGTSNINIPAAAGNISVVANNVSVMTITSVGANITGTANVTGNANVGNLGTAGNVTANYFIGNGALLTGIATSNQLFNGNSNVSIDANANVRITANGSANIMAFVGNGAYAANSNIGAIQPQNTYHRIGNVYVSSGGDYGHFSTHAWYTGGMWIGDGAVGGLFQIAGPTFNWYKGSACTSVTYTSLMSLDANGNLFANGTISSVGNITGANIFTTGNANVGNVNVTSNVQAGNLRTTGNISATGNLIAGNYIIIPSTATGTGAEGAQIVMSFAGGNAAANSIASTWNIDVGPSNDFRIFQYNAGGAVTVPLQIRQSSGNLDYAGNINSTANVNAVNVNTTAVVSAAGNITTSQFLNAGSMVVSGAATIGANANVTGRINVSNGISMANATNNIINWNTPGVAPPTTTAGYSAGTKAVFYDSKASNAAALGYTMGIENSTLFFTSDINFKWYAGTTTPVATLTPTTGLSLTGNVTAPYFVGNGALLTGIATSNKLFNGTSNVTIDPSANVRITVAGVADVVQVSSTGALITGNTQITGNLGIGGVPTAKLDIVGPAGVTSFTGTTKLGVLTRGSTSATDYSGVDFIGSSQTNPVARIAVQTTSSGSFLRFGTSNAYASGITNNALTIDYGSNVIVTGNFSVSGITTLGPVGNVKVTGGAAGQFLRTDGLGNLSWVAAGGTANVAGSSTQVQFNTGGAMDASANFTFDKTTNTLAVTNATNLGNLSVGGNASVAGNLNVTTGNIVAGANISLAGGTTNNKLIFNANGVAAPVLNGTSIGTRIILYPVSGVTTQTHFAMGIEGSSTWHSVPDNSCFTRWYAGVNQIANLNGVGQFTVANILSAVGNIVTTSNIAAGNLSVTGTTVMTGAITTPNTISAVGNISTAANVNATNANVTANVQAGNLRTTGSISSTGAITTASTISATGAITTASTISATGAITTASTISATGNITTAGFIQAAGLASSGNMAIPAGNSLLMGTNAGTSAKIIWDGAGAAPPSFNAFSAGTKLVLYPATAAPYTPNATEVGYALGIENSSIWYSTSNYANGFHRWYAGTTQIANLNYQAFTVAGNISTVGNVNSNNVNVTSNVQAGNLRTTGIVSATGVISTTGGIISAGIVSSFGTATLGNVIVPTGGTISAIGNIIGGNLVANGTVTGVTLSASGNVTGFNITTGGSVSATSNITGGNILTGGLISATSNITGGNISTAGTVTALSHVGNIFTPRAGGIFWPNDSAGDVANITYIRPTGDVGILDFNVQNDADDIIRLNASGGTSVVGNLTVGGNIAVTSNVQAGNLRTTGLISATGNITASSFITTGTITLGGVISATGSPAAISATGTINTLSTISATGTITGGNIVTAGAISATGVISATANIVTAANISATAGIFAQTISAIGNINSTGNIITNGTICTIGLIVNAGSSANFLTPINSNSPISTTGAITGISLNTSGNLNASNVVSTGNVNAGTNMSAAGNISSNANISALGNITANGFVSVLGNVQAGNLRTAGIISATGAITTANTISATGAINTASTISATGTVTVGNLSVTGSVIGNISIPGTANITTTNVTTLNVAGVANLATGAVIQDPANAAVTIPVGYRTSPVVPLTASTAGATIYSLSYSGDQYKNNGKTLLITGAAVLSLIRWDGVYAYNPRFEIGGRVTIINNSLGTVRADGTYWTTYFQRANSATITQSFDVGPNGYAVFTKIGNGSGPGGSDLWIVSSM